MQTVELEAAQVKVCNAGAVSRNRYTGLKMVGMRMRDRRKPTSIEARCGLALPMSSADVEHRSTDVGVHSRLVGSAGAGKSTPSV